MWEFVFSQKVEKNICYTEKKKRILAGHIYFESTKLSYLPASV